MTLFDEEKQIKSLEKLRRNEEEDLAQILSAKYGVEYVNLVAVHINNEALKLLPEKISRETKVGIFDKSGKNIKVAVLSPAHEETVKLLKKLKEEDGYKPTVFMVSTHSLKKLWDRYKEISYTTHTRAGIIDISADNLKKIIEQVHDLDEIKNNFHEILKNTDAHQVSRFFETLLASAIAINASDIHVEPEEKYVTIRFRLDGILVEVIQFDHKMYDTLLVRLKLIAGLKLNVIKKPQDGRLSIKLEDKDIEIRVSVLPDAYGESIVMRILNPDAISVSIEQLGIEPHLYKILMREIQRPNGMILNTGPTGSGKTTSLYAFFKKIYSPEIKIITIENPIEYHLPGIVQTQVDESKGYTFLEGLRSSLRQDPDVIMVGEIRDSETAKIAINSALTGHLVFSTLHTNDAAGTFYRLTDLGIQANIISTAVNIVIAQRLVRKPCAECMQETIIAGEDKEIIEKVIAEIEDVAKYTDNTQKMFVPVGCAKCNHTGYKGRIGIFEAILVDSETAKILSGTPSKDEIKNIFRAQGILTLIQDGIIKVLKGTTTLAEIKRVVDLE